MKDKIFAVNSGATIKELDEDCFLLYDSDTKKHLVGNRQFAEIVKKCNGTKTIDEIVLEISQEEKQQPEGIRIPVIKTVEKLTRDRMIKKTSEIELSNIRIIEKQSPLPLNTVYWEITTSCNFDCIHCYNSSTTPNQHNNQLDPYKTIDQLADAGVIDILITGGEPFIREDIFKIIEYAKSKHLDFAFFTNGSLINDEKAAMLKELNPKFMAVSFDSYDKDTFEKIRGPHYSKVLRNLKTMIEHELPIRMNVVIFNGLNSSYNHIENTISFFKDLGIKDGNVSIDEFLPTGKGEKTPPFSSDPSKIMRNIERAYEKIYSLPFTIIQDKDDLNIGSYCGIGVSVCYLKNNGDIALCPVLSSNEFIAGNITENPLLEIWTHSDQFKPFRDESIISGYCKKCDYLTQCAGGCKAKTKIFNNSFNSPDKWMCAYFGKSK